MGPKAESGLLGAGRYKPYDALDRNSESMTPEVAAERAANRIIEALRESKKGDSKRSSMLNGQA